jgi:hypothetical protein
VIKKTLLVSSISLWMLMFICIHIGSVMTTPEQFTFMHFNKMTKLYSLTSDYRSTLLSTKFQITGKQCTKKQCDLTVRFVGPHVSDSSKLTRWEQHVFVQPTKYSGWEFVTVPTERELILNAGKQDLAETVIFEPQSLSALDTALWVGSFFISMLVAPLLFLGFCSKIMFEKPSSLVCIMDVTQLMVATYLNVYISGYQFQEFAKYSSLINWSGVI